MVSIYIKENEPYTLPMRYILSVLSKNKSFEICWVKTNIDAQLIVDHTHASSILLNTEFWQSLVRDKAFDYHHYFTDTPYIRNSEGNIDYLGTAFYLINCIQEYQTAESSFNLDAYGRFRYEMSLQKALNCIEENIVQTCFDSFCAQIPCLSSIAKERTSRFFLSHDIDTLNGSFLQDGLWAIRHGRVDVVLRLIFNEIMAKPDWKNMDKISKMESDYDVVSCFFWLATKNIGCSNVKNADYDITKETKLIKPNNINALHKSCANYSIDEELDKLPFKTSYSRYHFLKFSLPDTWVSIDQSQINLDASLGFPEHFGFRNSYGLPFRPYNAEKGKTFNFVEVPLNIMDGTFHRYMNIPVTQTSTRIIDFIEKHRKNAVLSVLWHNTYFSNYKYHGYLQEYKKVLAYLHETELKPITPSEIVGEFYHE